MNTLTKNMVLFVLITLSFSQFIFAEQTEEHKRTIKYLTSEEQEILAPIFLQYMEEAVPTYISSIEIPRQMRFPRNMENKPLRSKNGQVKDSHGAILCYGIINDRNIKPMKLINFMFLYHDPNPNQSKKIKLSFFANSQEQAKEIAETFIRSLDNETDHRLNNLKHELETYQKIIREGDTVIPKMEAEYEDLDKKKSSLFKEYAQVNYLSNQNIPGTEEIIKVKDELARSLREADFELVGLDAKIDSINKYKLSGTIIDNETLIKLNQILITTDIERAGIFARKQAFETSLKKTNQLYDVIKSSETKSEALKRYKSQFNNAPQIISERKMKLENPSEEYQYTEIENNTVIIKPVIFK
ncbi:MAG: hypothetical protein JXA96_15875 [Sedimentisphaerales bacterium]|nr:hypothetical protein [Sedimentisphaerales bacterium]